jgi:hypothetical protein
MNISTREEWLTWAAEALRTSVFVNQKTMDLTNVRYSSGFPLGSRGSSKHLGQCLDPSVSQSGLTEIYISPTVSKSEDVLGVLHHELIHHYLGLSEGHGKRFADLARRTGLNGAASNTTPGPRAVAHYQEIIKSIGEYPHSEIKLPVYGSKGSNLKKTWCPKCGYTARLTDKWLNLYGPPICPFHNETMKKED